MPKNNKLENINTFAKYSGIAFEMLGIIILGVFGGIKIDKIADTKPLFTIILSLGAIFAALYLIIKKASK